VHAGRKVYAAHRFRDLPTKRVSIYRE